MKGRNKENTDFENDRLGNPQNGTRLPKMKKYSILLLLIAFFMSCKNVRQESPIVYFEGSIDSVRLVCSRYGLNYGFRDVLPESFLTKELNWITITITEKDTLESFQSILSKSVFMEQDSDMTFDTSIVALIDYQDGHTDTLGMSFNLRRGFIRGFQKFQNPALIDTIIRDLSYRDPYLLETIQRSYWKGDYKYQGAPCMSKKGERTYSIADYRCFRDTEVETLARNMYLENYDSIEMIIKKNPQLMYFRDNDGVLIIKHCIQFQQDTIVKLFLENGYDPNFCFYYEQIDSARYLGLPSKYLPAYTPPLVEACYDSYYNECALLLIQYGADVNTDVEALIPLFEAIIFRNYELAKVLIEHGANVNISRKTYYAEDMYHIDLNTEFFEEREYPIDKARKQDYFKMMHLLLTHGANIDTPYSRRVGDFRSYIESVNPEELTSADRRYLQKIKDYLKNQDNI